MKSINITRIYKMVLLIPVVALSLAVLPGCEKGPAEEAGEKVDKAAEKASDAVKDATK